MRILFLIYLQLFFSLPLNFRADTLKLLFLGDIMQHKAQLDAAHIRNKDANDPLSYNYIPYFQYLKDDFNSADVIITNMETVFGSTPYSGYPAFCSPSSLLTAASDAGIDIFLAANNHICDKGKTGIEMTINLYDTLNIKFTGIYRNMEEKITRDPLIINQKGIKVALLNYTYGINGNNIPTPFVVNIIDTNQIKIDIARSKNLNPDFIIACLHWGVEYSLKHDISQERVENFFFKNGVDIIIGSHPHVSQDIAIYQLDNGDIKHITFYSLGNVISNMTAPNTRNGLMAKILFYKGVNGEKKILPPECKTIFTARPGHKSTNYSVIPGEEYKNRKNITIK
ncbi:MAG: CapA family protein [Rikenellaceae bacterium]